MGRLLEAVKKRYQDLWDYRGNPEEAPKVSEDPQKGYDYILRLNELSYLWNKTGSYLTAALAKMSSGQRGDFFVQVFDERYLDELARRNFKEALARAYTEDNGKAFIDFLKDEKNIGWQLNVVVMGMRNTFGQKSLQKLQARLEKEHPGASLEEQAKFYYSNMEEKQIFDFYRDVLKEDCKEAYRLKALDDNIEDGQISKSLMNPASYKKNESYLSAVEKLEQIMDPQLAKETAEQIEQMPLPHLDPNKTITPYAQRIQELQKGLSSQDPKYLLLERVKEILVYPSYDYLTYLDRKDRDVEGAMGLQESMDTYTFHGVTRYLQDNLDAPLLEKLPKSKAKSHADWYDSLDVHPIRKRAVGTEGLDMEDAELESLHQKSAGAPIASEVKQAVHDFMKCVDQMGEKNYWIDGVVDFLEGDANDPKKVAYKTEQGNKKYAFWPLVKAKQRLAKAVEQGDFEEIRKAETEYRRRRGITDRMMDAVNRTAKAPIFGGNVNSTRPDDDGNDLNAMPTEYLEDYPGHCRANGLFLLYAASKNTGIPVDRLLDDPSKTFRDYGKQVLQEQFLSSQKDKPLGARLTHAFNKRLQVNAHTKWVLDLGLISRGLNAVIGLIPNEAERIQQMGQNYCAEAAAMYEVGQESVAWEHLSNAKLEQKQLVMQLAMLLPEEEFNLRDLGLAFAKKDWLKQMNPLSAIARLKEEHKLDYAAVTARSKDLLSQVEAAIQAGKGSSGVKLDDYREAALRNYNQLLRTMPADQRSTEGCKQMLAHAAELQNGLVRDQIKEKDLQDLRAEINTKLRTLSKRKSGWFLSEDDSPEYTRMVKSIKRLNRKLDLLEGKDPPANMSTKELEGLQKANVATLIDAAKYNCYNYVRLKTRDGTSGIIHTAGQERQQCAIELYEKLGSLSTKLNIRQPVVELKDLTKMELLQDRGSLDRKTAQVYAARMIYALSLQYRSVPNEQQWNLIDSSLDQAVERIMNQPAFRQMVRNEGTKGLADKIVAGTGALTEAYMKAARQVGQHGVQNQAAPQPSKEEKIDFWRQQEDPAAAPQGPALHL